jgi:hypothetical protein
MDDVAAQLLAKAEAVALRPGDTLVLNFAEGTLTPATAAMLRDRAQEALRGKNNAIVLTEASSVRTQPTQERPEHRACRRQS